MEESINTTKDRLKLLTNISERDIDKRILFCPKCLFQGQPAELMNSFCPDCKNRQIKTRLFNRRIDKELISIIKEYQDK